MSASGVQRGVGRLSTHFFPLTVPPTLLRPQSRGSWRPPRRENGKTPPRLDHGNKSLYENSNSAARVFLSKFIGSPVVDRWPRRPYSSTLLKIGDSIIWILNTPNPRFIDGKSKRLLVSISWNTDIPVHDIKMKYIYIYSTREKWHVSIRREVYLGLLIDPDKRRGYRDILSCFVRPILYFEAAVKF